MTKTFAIDNTEYTITDCTALNCEDERVNALLVENTADSGEKFQKVCFGYDMPETVEDFDDMCDDSCAWDSDYEVLETVQTC